MVWETAQRTRGFLSSSFNTSDVSGLQCVAAAESRKGASASDAEDLAGDWQSVTGLAVESLKLKHDSMPHCFAESLSSARSDGLWKANGGLERRIVQRYL